jgi:AcrR family transcriptional regulator
MPKVSDAHLVARRRQILDAAATCFARDGFHRTSMQDIVRESGISAGLVYRYFTGKDEMIAAIVTEWHEQREARLEPGRDTTGHLAEVYLDLLRGLGDPAALDDLRLGIQVWAEAVRSPRIRELVRRGVDGPRAATSALLRRAQEDGTLPAGLDPDALARIFIAIYQGLRLQTVWDDTLDNAAFVRTLEAILDALVATDPPTTGSV